MTPQSSLYEQIRLARLWLPLVIGVLLFQFVVLPVGEGAYRVWAPVIFYSVLGPIATYVTLNWIASEVQGRERAQADLARLYLELQASHEMLGSIHDVTARYAAAPDLEAVMRVAAEGVWRSWTRGRGPGGGLREWAPAQREPHTRAGGRRANATGRW